MSIFAELKRRNVFRVAVAYVAVSWLVIQVVDTLFPMFGLSDGAARAVVIVLAVGFLPAVIAAWAFELTPEGLVREEEVDRAAPAMRRMGKRLDRLIMVVMALALAYFAYDKIAEQPVPEPSIAVLSFDDLSPQGDQEYFAEGVAEELLNKLAKLGNLRVISRSSSFALRDEGLSAPEIAQRLNVSYVLEGSVRKDGEHVRITAQLIDARTDTHLWSETFDRTLDDVFAIQDQISARVAQELQVRILHSAAESASTSTVAHELHLQGLSLLARRESVGLVRAQDLFEQVIALDPAYAPAYAGLAEAIVWSDANLAGASRIEAAVNRALELDPGNADALAALGLLRSDQGRNEEAREAYERAIATNPNHALALRLLGRSHATSDPAQFYALARKAYFADPLDPTIHFQLSASAVSLGRFEEALDAAQELQQQGRENLSFTMAGRAHFSAGRLDLALQSFFLTFRQSPGDSSGYFMVPRVLMEMSELELAEAWLQELRETGLDSRSDSYLSGNLAFRRGNSEQALQLFAENEIRIGLPWGAVDLGFANVRMGGDFSVAQDAFERGLTAPGLDAPHFNADMWSWFMDYALALQRGGVSQRAAELINKMLNLLEQQAAGGVIVGPFENLQVSIARLHAMAGDVDTAMAALHRAARQGGLTCVYCLQKEPHFDRLREDARFAVLIVEAQARNDQQRERLADVELLLTPSDLLQLDVFSFDPFLN
jgi:TolB-like protein/cytochrome c-type biogenesis protein CcmH/NrfG